jgi:hypothetical protein
VDAPRGTGRDTWEKQSAIYKDAHRMALGFDHGRGIGVVALHQINREGGKRVLTMVEGGKVPRFDLVHLAESSEAGKSADFVTTSYLDERCRDGEVVLMDCLKARGRQPFKPFLASVRWDSMRVTSMGHGGDPAEFFGALADEACEAAPKKKALAQHALNLATEAFEV